ncbi:MAG TPA: hypothetical protein VFK33_15210 [Bacillales bacterium]|nr:hypothetical protein [Bacillales bacterium]
MPAHEDRYHCCATCRHFAIEKKGEQIVTRCARLGYETNPKWQFNCWNPKDRVRRVMAEERRQERLKRRGRSK